MLRAMRAQYDKGPRAVAPFPPSAEETPLWMGDECYNRVELHGNELWLKLMCDNNLLRVN